jgi:hypothetical protein
MPAPSHRASIDRVRVARHDRIGSDPRLDLLVWRGFHVPRESALRTW